MEPNTPTPYLPDGRQWAWNSTTLGIGKECLRKYKLAVIDGWRPRELNDDITFGHWYAKALENYHKYRADYKTDTMPHPHGCDHELALHIVVGETLCATGAWTSEHRTKDRQTLIRSIVWYLEEYKDDPCSTYILKDGRPAVELTFSFDYKKDITFCGHLDRVVEYAGDYYIQDQKTTGASMGAYYFKRFTPDNQMSLYTAAGQIMWQLPVKGVMIDAAQIAVGFTRFERGFAFRTPEQTEEWLKDAEWHIHNIWEATLKNEWPMNDAACQKYGGCQFLSICSKSPQVREEFLKTGFEKRPMNPLEIR